MLSKTLIWILTLIVFLTVIPFATLADENDTTEQALLAEIDTMLAEPRVPGEIIFFMEDGITLDEAEEILGDIGVPNNFDDESVYIYRSDMETLYTNEELWFTIRVGENQIRDYLYKLRTCSYVKSASPNMVYEPSGITEELAAIDMQVEAEASAPLESYDSDTTSWAMQKMGVAQAWKAGFTGSTNVIVAVLDTGYTTHNDISCVNTSLGRNAYVSSSTYDSADYGYDITDESGHGTFIAGQIGATLNGNKVNGICKNITIVPIKITKKTRVTETIDGVTTIKTKHLTNSTSVSRGVRYAKSINANIINYSFSLSATESFEDICDENYSGLFVAAAGNDGKTIITSDEAVNPDDVVNVGLANDAPNWIVVGNSTSLDERAESSNVSSIYVDLFAPGIGIKGCGILGNNIVEMSGTSMAAPHVAAAAALIMSHATHLSVVEVKQLLMDSATPIDDLEGLCVSGGRLSIIGAIETLYDAPRPAYSSGDANGDGTIDTIDYMYVKRSILGTYTLNSSQTQGADTNSDGSVNTLDYMMVRRFVLGTHYISPE